MWVRTEGGLINLMKDRDPNFLRLSHGWSGGHRFTKRLCLLVVLANGMAEQAPSEDERQQWEALRAKRGDPGSAA